MLRRSIIFITTITILTSCADLHIGRSYLSEMGQEDNHYFNPDKDFPVVNGDNGDVWMTEKERRARTPASAEDEADARTKSSLNHELQDLEASQSEESLELYEEHKKDFATTSEKIFFLKLPPHERKDYLMNRGFIEEPKAEHLTAFEKMNALRNQDILQGMTKSDVISSWGKPERVDVAGNPRNENERWLYRLSSRNSPKYIYFESGLVQGWE